jgi:hypothetical protein
VAIAYRYGAKETQVNKVAFQWVTALVIGFGIGAAIAAVILLVVG